MSSGLAQRITALSLSVNSSRHGAVQSQSHYLPRLYVYERLSCQKMRLIPKEKDISTNLKSKLINKSPVLQCFSLASYLHPYPVCCH